MRVLVLLLPLFQLLLFPGSAHGARRHQEVIVADPYLEMHTGPGRGYPIFHVVGRGDQVAIVKRRTEWFKVRAERGAAGWVSRDQMEQTLQLTGEKTRFRDPTLRDYAESRWETGVMGGDFGGADVISTYGSYSFTPNLSTELWVSQILGNFSNSYMANARIVHLFFPEWRVSPFFALGTGVIHTEPKSTLVAAEDRTDQVGHVGLGIRTYVRGRFVFRAEYNSYVVFTSRDDNEEIEEWKAGFSFFF